MSAETRANLHTMAADLALVGGVERSVLSGIAVVVAGGLFGLGLPLLFDDLTSPGLALLWLTLAAAACVCLVLPARTLASALATQIRRLPGMRREESTWSRTPVDIARLLDAAGYVVLLQAILRQPLKAVFGASVEPFIIEAVLGILTLLLVLALFAWLHVAGRPLVEGMAWVALDSAFATSGSEQANEAASTVRRDAVTVAAPRPRGTNDATQSAALATIATAPPGGDATVADAAATVAVEQQRA